MVMSICSVLPVEYAYKAQRKVRKVYIWRKKEVETTPAKKRLVHFSLLDFPGNWSLHIAF